MSEHTRKQVNYTVTCIHEFARRKNISQRDAYLFLQKYQGISFLNEFYDVEHTLSMNDAMDDLEKYAGRTGEYCHDLVSWIEYRVNRIDLAKCRPYKDFGKGFYLTELQDQAMRMAKRVARIYGGEPIVTYFEADVDKMLKPFY